MPPLPILELLLPAAALGAEKISKHISGVVFKLLNVLNPNLPLSSQETVQTPYVSAEFTEFALRLNLRISCDLSVYIKIDNIPLVFNITSWLSRLFFRDSEKFMNCH